MTTYQVQLLLAHLKYDVKSDGFNGPQTRAAVTSFQKEYGNLVPDGYAGTKTEDAIIRAVVDGWKRPTESQPQDEPDVTDTNAGDTGLFWDDIPNFTRDEFKCQCGGQYCNGFPAEPQEAMVRLAQAARTHFGRPATVISGLRCAKHNANVDGVENSQHMYGEACDINISGVPQSTVLAWFQAQPGVRYAYAIKGSNNVHFDIPMGAR